MSAAAGVPTSTAARAAAEPPQPRPQAGAPAAKRRRLSAKGPAPHVVSPAPPAPGPPLPICTSFWNDVDEATFEKWEHRRKYRTIHNKFLWWFRKQEVWTSRQDSQCTEELWQLARMDFHGLSRRQKNVVMRHFLVCSGAPPWVLRYGVSTWPCDESDEKPKVILKAQTALLTYQGDWGLLPLSDQTPWSASDAELAAHVSAMKESRTLWTAFREFSERLASDLYAPLFACCLELCMHTWQDEKLLRLHGHLFLKSDNGLIRCSNARVLRFLYADPHVKDTLWGRKVAKANWAGAYYCLAPKIGSVFTHGSLRRFRDFPVDPSWIFNLIEGGKMGYHEARSELVQCGKGLVRRLADLECWHKNRQDMLVQEMVTRAQIATRQTFKPFPRHVVVDKWLAEVAIPMLPRKPFLVLHGPSKRGKTEFVRGLFALGAVFELNCANMKDICLDGFDCFHHRCILWDEASASLVARNRKVFQHPLCQVDLGHSPTGQHVKRYFLGNSCSILATNSWPHDLKKLPAGDQDWINSNAVVFNVEKPLWETPDPVESMQQAMSSLEL